LLLLGSSSGPRHRVGKTSAAHPTPARTGITNASSTPTSQSPRASSTPSASPTVPAAAAELTRLVTQDLAAGTIDPQASQQILARLQDILNTYGNGNVNDTTHKLDDLSKQVAQLSGHGDIQPTALPAITRAIGDLRSALARATPAGNNPAATPAPAPPKHPKPTKAPPH
jgi:hypothetical protein